MNQNHYSQSKGNPPSKKRVGGTFGRKARIEQSLRKAKKMKGTRHVVPAQLA